MKGFAIGFAFLLFATVGCAGRGPGGEEPLRLSELDGGGDPTRRASLRLCVEGLDADAAGHPSSALVYYERAIQVDPTNPYAYLSLSRHELDGGNPDAALDYLNRSEQLFGFEAMRSPRVEAHLAGLRGAAMNASGHDGSAHLLEAYRLAPSVWEDGRLDALELR